MSNIILTAQGELERIRATANVMQIRSVQDRDVAAETVTIASKMAKLLEEQRKAETKPLLDKKAAIDSQYNALRDQFLGIQKAVGDKILQYNREEQRRIDEENRRIEEARRKAEEEQRRAEEEARREAEKKAEQAKEETGIDIPAEMFQKEVEDPLVPIEMLQGLVEPPPSKRVVTTSGGIQIKKPWTFKIVDAQKIPREFLEVNEVAIRKAIREGERNIPGVEIFQEERVASL